MADGPNSGWGIAGNGFIWLFMMATGTLFLTHGQPLVGSRPMSAEPEIRDDRGPQNVAARLWQDPFAAVRASLDAREKPAPAPARLEDLAAGAAPKPLILAVTVPGSPYVEDAEARRRDRYAVLAGLNVQGYVPKDGGHIGYLAPPEGTVSLPKIIPFERFDPASADQPEVLVLWLDEAALTMAARPLASLSRLADALAKGAWDAPMGPEARLLQPPATADGSAGSTQSRGIRIIGPSSSTMLRAMASEVPGLAPPDCTPAAGAAAARSYPFEFFDFGATVDDDSLRRIMCRDAPRPTPAAGASGEELFRHAGLSFHRLTAPDDTLVKALVDELSRRQVRPGKECGLWYQSPCDYVAILGEWDTPYGQALLPTMKAAFGDDSRVLEFSYLRGLDGQLPGRGAAGAGTDADKSATADDSGKSKSDATSRATAKQLEQPDGQGQFDYLRRLAARIERSDDDLRRAGSGRIAGVGVLGSDPYDKLLVLQALRPVLPTAVFFTTDLDARFSSPGERRATRNLVIASGYGLELRPATQGAIPPFRDTYQTAAFLATQLAVRDGSKADCTGWAPRIFEIGRSGAVSLPAADRRTAGTGADSMARSGSGSLQCDGNDPASTPVVPAFPAGWARYATIVLAGLLVAGTSLAGAGILTPFLRPATGSRRWLVIGGAAFFLGAALCASWDSWAPWLAGGDDGEPMLLTEGISLWPTIILRAGSFLIGVALIVYSFGRLDKSIGGIARRLRLDELRDGLLAEEDSERRGFRRVWHDVFSPRLLPGATKDAPRDLTAFWRIYVRRGRVGARTARVVVCIAAMVGLWFILVPIFGGPTVPSRGDTADRVYLVVTLLDVMATWFLIFLVADATLFSCQFVRGLRNAGLVWPERSRNAFAALLGIEGPAVDQWIGTRFVAMRTQCIIGMIYFPFLLVALLIVSRSTAFDGFAPNSTLLIIQGVSLAVLAGCVIWLRVEAEETRKTAHANMTDALITTRGEAAHGRHGKRGDAVAARIEELIRQVDALQEGAFAPISHQPMVRALALPLGSYGGTALLDYLSLAGI